MEASYELSRKQGFLKKNIETFVKQTIGPRVGEINGTGDFPREILKGLAGNRLLGMLVPKEDGGEGAGFLDFCLVVEGIATVCPTSALICLIQNLGARLLTREGRPEQKDACLPGLMAGERVFGYVATSSDALSLDLLDTPLTLTVEGDRCLVNGPACVVINGDAADVIFAFARNQETDGCFLLEKDAAGLSMTETEGFVGAEARCTCTAVIENCSLPEAAVLGTLGKGKAIMKEMICEASVFTSAMALGVGQGALDYATQYAGEREQFGMQIRRFQAVQMMLATMGVKMETVRQLVYRAASVLDQKSRERYGLCSAAKSFASRTAMEATTDAVQVAGGYGYMKDYPLQKMMRAAQLTQVLNGTIHSHELAALG
ncbi:MAG: acyl-CoA dehydrogenase family protein [Deltaproteobacteria bacterium]|nr:acyl-CoA dehydrogenase family protein [Deltaproteobacteria bacterium]MBW1817745.1 acyl-CoA dehydrogenase family protein [Deltaproteobacteria bacterium]MBW2283481.1 acyl-CoA dehydrogenase family protein [Deltaproteobacteria bacterium]